MASPNLLFVRQILDDALKKYYHLSFVKDDPISIPHSYSSLQDIEITAFWTSILAWGQRKTIIHKSKELFRLMGDSPYDFILHHKEKDRQRFAGFKHRTFQYTDTLYFLDFLQRHYQTYDSLEEAFLNRGKFQDMKSSLSGFYDYFFDAPYAPQRTKKHIANPAKKSKCKKLNMFLRWMVRKDKVGIDFGLWHRIPMSGLMIPLDVHVERMARRLGLLSRTQSDWEAVVELTNNLKLLSSHDPIKYDFALFNMGIYQEKLSL